MNTVQEVHSSNKLLMAIFWLYVLIPLVWGVANTLMQAVKLFH